MGTRVERWAAVLLLVGAVVCLALALWDACSLWDAAAVKALVLAPVVLAAIVTVAGRSLGVLLLVAAAIPAGLLMLLLDGPAPATREVWLSSLGCSLGALVVFHLFVHRLVRRDARAAALGLVLAAIAGLATMIVVGPVREQLLWDNGVWQGWREANRDWHAGRIRVTSVSWDDRPYGYCRDALRRFGIGVTDRFPCSGYHDELRARDHGYDEVAQRLIRERYGAAFFTDLGCGLERPPEEPPD
jgi:hypothetical protein